MMQMSHCANLRCLWVTYRPDLSVGGQLEGLATNREEQTLQVCKLSGGQAQETDIVIQNGTSGRPVPVERI